MTSLSWVGDGLEGFPGDELSPGVEDLSEYSQTEVETRERVTTSDCLAGELIGLPSCRTFLASPTNFNQSHETPC